MQVIMRIAAAKFLFALVLACSSVSGCQTTSNSAYMENPGFEDLVEVYKTSRDHFDHDRHDEGVEACTYVLDHIEAFTYSNKYQNYRKQFVRYYCLEPIAYVYLAREEWGKAHNYLERAQRDALDMAGYRSGDIDLQTRIANNYLWIAQSLGHQNIEAGILEAMTEARDIYHWLTVTDSDSVRWQLTIIPLDWGISVIGDLKKISNPSDSEALAIVTSATSKAENQLGTLRSQYQDDLKVQKAADLLDEWIQRVSKRLDEFEIMDFPIIGESIPSPASTS